MPSAASGGERSPGDGRLSGPARLRRLLREDRLIVAPGAFDPFTARIIESLGFPAVYLGGHSMGINLCVGQPFLTLTETVDFALRTLRAIDIPLILDVGAGFGDPAHVRRTTREVEASGAAALQLDDQVFPKRAHYHRGKGRLVPAREMVERLHEALAARANPDFVVIARTDAMRATGSVREAVERCQEYVEAGADVAMVLDLKPEGASAVRQVLRTTPLAWIGGVADPGPHVDELRTAGFQLAVYPFNTAAAVFDSVTRTWSGLANDGRVAQADELLARARPGVLDLIGMKTYWEIEERTTERGDAH